MHGVTSVATWDHGAYCQMVADTFEVLSPAQRRVFATLDIENEAAQYAGESEVSWLRLREGPRSGPMLGRSRSELSQCDRHHAKTRTVSTVLGNRYSVAILIFFLRGRDRARQPKMIPDHHPIFFSQQPVLRNWGLI
jgi:hypothetical protein